MDVDVLQDRIQHARTLTALPENLPVADLGELIRQRSGQDESFLTFIDAEGQRVEWTYREFCRRVLGVARFLKGHGLRHGDRIATVSHNHCHTVIHYFAAWYLGLVVVPVNLSEDDGRIAYILDQGNIEMAFVRSEYAERIHGIIHRNDGLKNIEVVLCEDTISHYYREGEPPRPEPESMAESEALIVFTSGTTGAPKAVVLTQRNLLEDARAIANWHGIDKETRMMCVLPIHHVNGTVVTMITPFYAGGSVVLNQKFSAGRFFPLIRDEQVHIVSMVPTLLQYLNNQYQDRSRPDCPALRHVICGAGPLTVNVAETFEEKLKVPVIHGYGLSETTCYSCFIPVGLDHDEHVKWRSEYGYPSIGVPLPVNEMAIHDEEGTPQEENVRGEIVIRGVNVMQGYYNNPEANEETFKHGWFRSGDEGFYIKDDQGKPYFFITGRLKELIIRGGVNLAPLEIDEVINKAPGVDAGIAVGFENDWYGEEVGAYVQLKEGAPEDAQAIIDFCSLHLPHSKTPKVVVFGNRIPVTSTGKYQRRKVAHLFQEWKEVQFRKPD